MSASLSEILFANLQSVHASIQAACRRAGREVDSVRLVAVTKYAPWNAVVELAKNCRLFGESRPQQLAERHQQLPNVEWHLIGQLQRNKVPLALKHAAVIHSVDSVRLLERIAAVAKDREMSPGLLLQVNLSGETTKSGFAENELRACWPQLLQSFPHLRYSGLMTMAAAADDPEEARPVFQRLRQLRDQLESDDTARAGGIRLPELSMGMSGDYVQAVEEGATLIRIGSRLFEGIE